MTIVLGAVAGVVFVALVGSLLAWRSASRRSGEAGERAAEAEQSAQRAVDSAEKLSNDLAEERKRGNEAVGRATEAEGRVSEAEGRAAAAQARAAGAESELAVLRSGGASGVVAEVERVRLEREWQEVAGPGAALPIAWDGSLPGALRIELEIIREVTGTPSRFELDEAAEDPDLSGEGAWVLAALGCEMLRIVARHADEMAVKLANTPAGRLGITAEAVGAQAPADLSSIGAAAKGSGLGLTVDQTADGFVVWLGSEG